MNAAKTVWLGLALMASWAACALAADPNAPADITITNTVLKPREKVPPLGANEFGKCGAIEWAANNFVHNPGNEPIYWRNLHRVMNCGPNWFEIDGPGTSWWALWGSGFLSGANLRIYRLVDKDGKLLPPNSRDDYFDADKADHVVFVGKAQIIPEGAKDFPDGGWIANKYSEPQPNAQIKHGNLACTDCSGLENGRTYWYVVTAIGPDNAESEYSNEVSAAPKSGADTPPHIVIPKDGDPAPTDTAPKVFGGQAPYRWEIVGEQNQPLSLPTWVIPDPATGKIDASKNANAPAVRIILKVTDVKGRSDTRAYNIAPKEPPAAKPAANAKSNTNAKPGDKAAAPDKPQPPQNLVATPGDGCVTLAWKASASPDVVAYRVKRSTAPAAKQESRVYISEGAPKLEKFDYVVLEKRFGNFDMRLVNQRVRGIGNPMDAPNWYWNGDLGKLAFTFVPHPKPLPAEMDDPGETCMQVKASAGEQTISQFVFIGTGMAGESLWYGQLEPEKKYRLEVWLRQEGLANDGAVAFSFAKGYPEIRQTFKVTNEWK
ncbi:MAG: hypothetical protein NTX50_11895, partial [Candidatus Sumerlaeota bacterium]|nr:hypothetical protein [Candidatus Sumerlaeota bacterium]